MKATPTILLVDDDEDHRFITRSQLSRLKAAKKFRIEEATNGTEALAKLNKLVPAAEVFVLSDYRMSPMNGFELLKAVRQKYPKVTIRFALLTSTEQLADSAELFSAGADEFLVKPLDLDEFRKHLGRLVEEWIADM